MPDYLFVFQKFKIRFLTPYICFFAFISSQSFAGTRTLTGSAEVSSIGSVSDRVLWHFRPGLNLAWEPKIFESSNVGFSFEGRLRTDTQSKFVSSQGHYDFVPDRALVQWSGNQTNFSLGWQKYTWGDSGFWDGVDVLNPRDLNETPYTDDELLKIPVPSLSAQFLGDNSIFQAVCVVKSQRSPIPDELESLKIFSPRELLFFESPEFGLKAGGLLKSGWDINGYLVSHLERVPQFVLIQSEQMIPSLRAYEPRVLTLGLTGTQASGDFVFRSEIAIHFNRAVPVSGALQENQADQIVLRLTSDLNVMSDLIVSGEYWAEKWNESSVESFRNTSSLLGIRMMKPFFDAEVESNIGFLTSIYGDEWFARGGLLWKFSSQWQLDLDINFVKLSKGHALARRNLKDLLRSGLKFQF